MADYVIRVQVSASGANEAYGVVNIPGTPADVWVRASVYVVSGLPSGLFPAPDMVVLNEGTYGWFLDDAVNNPVYPYYADNAPFGTVPTGVWRTIDYRVQPGTPLVEELWIDNVDQGEVCTSNATDAITSAWFGATFAGAFASEFYMRDLAIGTTRGGSDIWLGDLSSGNVNDVFDSVVQNTSSISVYDLTPIVPTVVPTKRHWRYVIADLATGQPIAVWDTVARNRSITYELDTPTTIRGLVSSDNKLVNGTADDGFPILTEGDRILYAFRRDYNGQPGGTWAPWQCRAAGIILEVEDAGDQENSDTAFTAYDPWQYLMALPIYNPSAPTPEQGTWPLEYVNTPIQEIVVDLLMLAEGAYDFANPYKTGIDYTSGTLEFLPSVDVTFPPETSIGQAWQQLCAMGCDIVLDPIYDPVGRAGAMVVLNVYAQAGEDKPDVVFAWDKGQRSLIQDNRQIDGTLRQNRVRYHVQADGTNTEFTATESNLASVARFGDYWGTQYYPAGTDDSVSEMAVETLAEFGEGKRSITLAPIPERSPDPFIDYYLGDMVRVFSSRKFRAAQSGYQRITGFTVEISDDALETVRDLRVYIPPEGGT